MINSDFRSSRDEVRNARPKLKLLNHVPRVRYLKTKNPIGFLRSVMRHVVFLQFEPIFGGP
jgi:hypothetical protein